MTVFNREDFPNPPPPGRVGWCKAEPYNRNVGVYERRRFCETPHHAGSFTPAEFVLMVADFDGCIIIQGMCRPCMTHVATDMGYDPDTHALY